MDSAKTTKLFPDFAETPATSHSQLPKSNSDFQVAGGVWESLLREPAFEAQLRFWIDKVASERVQDRIKEIEKQAYDSAHAQGMKDGLQRGAEATKNAMQALDQMAQELVQQKSALLKNHEHTFCETFFGVLEKLAVPEPAEWTRHVEGVLSQYSTEFGEKGRVEVFVCSTTWSELQAAGVQTIEGLRWVVKMDESLSPGALRFDFGGVGLDLAALSQIKEWKQAAQSNFKKAS